MALAERLRALREARGLSVPALARRAGIAHPYLYKLEAGTATRPSGDTLAKLAEALQVPLSELGEGAEYITQPLADPEEAEIVRLVERLQMADARDFLRTLGKLSADDQAAVADMARRLARRPVARILGEPAPPPPPASREGGAA